MLPLLYYHALYLRSTKPNTGRFKKCHILRLSSKFYGNFSLLYSAFVFGTA
jgi:hypothetical protein